jgi:protocatechuate 3,4-dioxygenase beta subunit
MVKRLLLLLLLFVAVSLSAQSFHLTGSVKSSDGKPVPNASIELREQDTGARRNTASDHEGSYQFHGLKAGTYQATVQAQGFRTLTRDGIRVTGETKLELNLTLEPSRKSP